MSNEDVIELGSSDEEAREPAPKKSKHMHTDAMVCIPAKYHDVTIQPAKSTLPTFLPGNKINNKKIINVNLPIANKNKVNGKPVQAAKIGPKIAYNPFAEQKKLMVIPSKPLNSALSITKLPFQKHVMPKIQSKGVTPFLKARAPNVSNLNLPSSITIRRTAPSKSIAALNVKKKKLKAPNIVNDVLTVELDDDEGTTSSNSPQWYIRPEDQKKEPIPEEENNKEPETDKLIEITIEDSPIKPVQNKRRNEISSESAIVIEDSPVKVVADKENNGSGSENEAENACNDEPQSKKKLEYPLKVDSNQTIEIEIKNAYEASENNDGKENETVENTIISEEQSNLSKNLKEQITTETSNKQINDVQNSDSNEFHPVYQSFIDLCFQLENSEDMNKIVEKKIKGYYKQVPKEYTESEEFIDMVSSKILSMKAVPENMYLFIKDIVDELNMQRKIAKSQPIVKKSETEEPIEYFEEKSTCGSKRDRQIRKLEKTIKKLHRAIQKLEEQEVDFDDDDDSVYILTERYKERMVRVYAKFCQLSNTKMPSEPRIILDMAPGQPIGPAKKLEKWINKKVPIGSPLPFPDFHDVLRCVREANDEDKLGFNEADIMEHARELFVRCGKKLQRRRQENEWRLAASRITLETDPAEKNTELQNKLSQNKKIAAQKEIEIFNKYADRQKQLKLEAVEIGDKEAEESPVESEEEEEVNNEDVSLENTEKRKERLKRLIHEQYKKSNEEQETETPDKEQVIEKEFTEIDTNLQTICDFQEQKGMEKEIISTTDTKSKSGVSGNETVKEVVPANDLESSNAKPENQMSESKDNNISEQAKNQESSQNATETLTLSDDSDELESDMDELHLLQKLHKSNADESSTVDTSDSESPIAISDSLDSSEDNRRVMDDDVISIENSSYSEAEDDNIVSKQQAKTDTVQLTKKDTLGLEEKTFPSTDDNAMDVDFSSAKDLEVPSCSNNDEYRNLMEDVLLASAEEDNSGPADGACINLKDDLISIDETVIGVTKKSGIAEDNQSTPILIEDNDKCDQEKVEASKVQTDELIINSVESNCESTDETTQKNTEVVLVDDHSNDLLETMESQEDNNAIIESNTMNNEEDIVQTIHALLNDDSDKCSQVEENIEDNEIPTEQIIINSIESNCEFVEETSNELIENMDVNMVSEPQIDKDNDKSSPVEDIAKEIPITDDLKINSIESNSESPQESSQNNGDVVFLDDHSNELVESMDVDHHVNAVNEINMLDNQQGNVLATCTEIS